MNQYFNPRKMGGAMRKQTFKIEQADGYKMRGRFRIWLNGHILTTWKLLNFNSFGILVYF